jgi:hypothetical protein
MTFTGLQHTIAKFIVKSYMRNVGCIVKALLTVTFSASAMAGPIVEKWISARNSYDLHATGADRFVIEHDKNYESRPIAKFTVRPGDVFNNSTGEQSAVNLGGWQSTSRFRVQGNEGVEFYRVSVKLATGWTPPEKNSRGYTWGLFFEAHGPNEYMAPPAVAIHVENNFSLFVLGGDLNAKVGGRRFLTKSSLNIGRWVDFVLKIKWAPDETGAVAVWRRDEGESAWEKVADIEAVATLQHKGIPIPNSHYWRAGFYRSESKHTNVLWLGPILRGRSFDEVVGER